MIITGSRGLSGATAALDSLTDAVVHYSVVPVMVVPYPLLSGDRGRARNGPVVVGWDGSPGADAALEHATGLFPGRELLAVTVGGDAGRAPAVAGRTVRHRDVPVPAPMAGRSRAVAEALSATAQREGAGIVVVGSRGRSALREIVLGSAAMAALHHAHLPVLVVPHPNDPDPLPGE